MYQSIAEIYLHFVWATYRRMPLVSAEIEQAVLCLYSPGGEQQRM